MRLKKINKTYAGKFLTYYVAEYLNNENKTKAYEFISRNKNLSTSNFGECVPCGVGIIPLSINGDKVLLQQEFRMACNQWVYNFPTGLIDEGETPVEAATRELWEETGVDLKEVLDVLPPSFASAPTSDEVMIMVIAKCEGSIGSSTSADEEIKAKWYTKEEIKELFAKRVMMSVRTQIFLWDWINK